MQRLMVSFQHQHILDYQPCSKFALALPPDEGAFLPRTFWLADNPALQGRTDEARRRFHRLLSIRNDVGLLSEEV